MLKIIEGMIVTFLFVSIFAMVGVVGITVQELTRSDEGVSCFIAEEGDGFDEK